MNINEQKKDSYTSTVFSGGSSSLTGSSKGFGFFFLKTNETRWLK